MVVFAVDRLARLKGLGGVFLNPLERGGADSLLFVDDLTNQNSDNVAVFCCDSGLAAGGEGDAGDPDFVFADFLENDGAPVSYTHLTLPT
ncbi:hypothetical protein ACYCEV_00415, partial [Aerococcus mictus]